MTSPAATSLSLEVDCNSCICIAFWCLPFAQPMRNPMWSIETCFLASVCHSLICLSLSFRHLLKAQHDMCFINMCYTLFLVVVTHSWPKERFKESLNKTECAISQHLIFNLRTQFREMRDNSSWNFQASHLPVIIMDHKISTIFPLVYHLSPALEISYNSIKSLNMYHYATVVCTHIEMHLS